MVQNPDTANWTGEIKIYEDAALTTEVPNAGQTSILSVELLACDPQPILSGCSPDYVGIQELACFEAQFEADIAQFAAEEKCVKPLNWQKVTKECKDCVTGRVITVIDPCESLKALVSAYFLARQ